MSNIDSKLRKKSINNSKLSAELAHKIISGDKNSSNEFVQINYNWLLFIIRRKFSSSNNHEDIIQDAFILVINKLQLGQVKNPERILFFLRSTAINIGFEYFRKDKKHISPFDQDIINSIESSQPDILSNIIWENKIEHVKQVVSELKVERDKKILDKFYFQDQGKPSICQELKLSPEHFDRVLYRAKQRLKQLIDFKGNNSDGNIRSINNKKNKKSSNSMLKLITKLSKTCTHLFNSLNTRVVA